MSKIDPTRVRNVGILGHSGVGKTMLLEHLLNDAGVTARLGSIEEGTTVCDYLEEEIEHKHSCAMKLCHLDWHGSRIHFVDHPGYTDFLGEVAASVPLLDGVIIMVDATTGIQVGTDLAWRYAQKYKVPRAFFVNKLEKDDTDFMAVVKTIRETYGKRCVPLVVPIGQGEGMTSSVNIFDGDISSIADEVAALKEEMADAVAETDDKLLEKYLETGVLTPDEFHRALHDGITAAEIMPIIAGSVVQNFGVDELLDVVADSFPMPVDRHVQVYNGSADLQEIKVDADAPFVGQVFRNIVDPYVGQLTLFRVLTGTLKSDSEMLNTTRGHKERVGKLLLLNGKEQQQVDEVGPGDLAALTKLKDTHFGDTLAAPGVEYRMPDIEMPESLVKLAIRPKTRADEDKIGEALSRVHEEDPTFVHFRCEETHEHVICGMGDLHLDMVLAKMKRKFNVDAETSLPRIAYKETIKGTAEAHGRHKKQSGGHGQFGDVHIRLRSMERGGGYEFVDSIVGGVVPRQFIPAVDKGAQDALEKGIVAGYPVVDVSVELYDGSFHTVDSSEMAFKVAASMAIQEAFRKAHPVLLEPVMEIAITVPDDYMGDVTGDLNSRRGRILGMEPAGGGRQTIRAHIPEAETLRYSTVLRSMTGGRGSYTLHFDHYDEVPEHLTKPIIDAYEKERAEGH
jgi:elongation factor G